MKKNMCSTLPSKERTWVFFAGRLRIIWAPVSLAFLAGCGPPTGPKDVDHLVIQNGSGLSAAAGTPTATPPSVLAEDKKGNPVRAAPIIFAPLQGAGTIANGNVVTDEDGIAAAGPWTLGTETGRQWLEARVDGYPDVKVSFLAHSVVGPPAIMEKAEGDQQIGTAGLAVATKLKVVLTDQVGNPVSRTDVIFSVESGGGSVSSGPTRTNTRGEAVLFEWILGPTPGGNTVSATSGTASALFSATGISGPTDISIDAGDGQAAVVNTTLPVNPRVLVSDALGNPVSDVTVEFAIMSGGGSLSVSNVLTDPTGLASVEWTLGTTVTTNRLFAKIGELVSPLFTASAEPGAAVTVRAKEGNNQKAIAGFSVPIRPGALVEDQFGNPVPGAAVDFAVTSGGGAISGSPAVTGPDGIARITDWTLGPGVGENTVEATTGALSPAVFTATGIASGYDVELVFLTGVTTTQRQAFETAVTRWRTWIPGDLTDVSFAVETVPADACASGQPVINDVVDDLRIYVLIESIDGPGGILGSAGPCYIRDADSLPVIGRMRFDTADLENLESNGLLEPVILHEIGHVIGVGTLWNYFGLLQDPSNSSNQNDTHFNGPRTISAFDSIGGATYSGQKVPVENSGATGTINAHWRESVFNNELMTGFINAGTNPGSAVTIASLGDVGYVVNTAAADNYSLPFSAPSADLVTPTARIRLFGDVWTGQIMVVGNTGKVLRVIHE